MNSRSKFKQFFPIAEAMCALFYPHIEVVLHDTRTGKIVNIWNAFSERKAGDYSHLDDSPDLFEKNLVYGPYPKDLRDGRRTKSITAILNDSDGRQIGYFCINLNVTMLDAAAEMLGQFISSKTERPEPTYHNDIQEHINYLLRAYIKERNKTLDALTRDERAELVAAIEAGGVFQARNSVALVAKTLSVSRASIYNLLAHAKRINGKSR
jgi:D-arginine utilization repressor